MRRLPRSFALVPAAAGVAVALVVAVSAGGSDVAAPSTAPSWLGLVGGGRAPTPAGQRMIVLLKTPSVAQRLAKVGYATEAQERSWSTQAVAAQKEALVSLAAHGLQVRPDYSYTRVVDGFSAALDPRAVPLLENDPEVAGVYPVRAAFPAATSETVLASKAFSAASGHWPEADLPGVDGRGVTIALLDTGVDLDQPYLRGRLLPGFDVVNGDDDARARANPHDPQEVERHGTELAGILAGSDGPAGLHGVAPGATILPVRVAGWQTASSGRQLVFGRTDQLIAGLERAVDPNGDGDCHDAVRVALIGLAEPYAAFTDGPEAQAAEGALALDTLVVTPAGNDGAAGPGFGSIAGPAASPGALAVAATDPRVELPEARVVLRRGLDVIFDRDVPLLSPAGGSHALSLGIAPASAGVDAFDRNGFSRVAGRAVVAPVGSEPETQAAAATRQGASALVLYGDALPAGSLRVGEQETAPVVVVPTAPALELLAAERAGLDVGVAIGPARDHRNTTRGNVADFSSRGLAFDGSVKPDVAAPGVAIATSEPGIAPDGSPVYGTVNGTSAAAATVAGGAALLAELRPELDGAALKSLLTGYAQAGGASTTEAGAGTFRLGASAVGEVAAQPSTLGFGIWQGRHWHGTRTIVVHNVSSRALQLSISVVANAESEALGFTVKPDRLLLGIGRAARVKIRIVAPTAPHEQTVTGVVRIAPAGSEPLRVPWAVAFSRPTQSLLAKVSMSAHAFKQSDTRPAVLTVQAGNLVRREGSLLVQPVSRLDVLLYTAGGRYVGLLARLRDLLPGAYSFGITGRGPSSAPLAPGAYELRLAAWPTLPNDAQPSRAKVRFSVS
ncbi:MAG TPA: S8 family serine peptidase [Gaiellaceae bacterium]|nr:S8 family serine peptidase [Gaiellaceae bacterium]